MPDTGAPWNIPYVAGTDLVSDWPTDSQELAEAIADGLDLAGPAGIGSNVVQTVKLDTFTTTSTSFTDLTGMSAAITPSSNTAKVLVVVQLSYAHSNTGSRPRINLVRDSTNIFQSTGGSVANQTLTPKFIPSTDLIIPGMIVFLDSPATASSVTYKIQVAVSGNTMTVNREGGSSEQGSTSSITLIEVAP